MSNSLWPYGLYLINFLCPWDFQERTQEWVAISFSKILIRWCFKVESIPSCSLIGISVIGKILRIYYRKWKGVIQFSSGSQSCQLFATPWIAAGQASISITNSRSSPKLMSIESVMPSSHLLLCRPLLLLPPIPPSIRVFQWVNSLHEVAKVLEFQL